MQHSQVKRDTKFCFVSVWMFIYRCHTPFIESSQAETFIHNHRHALFIPHGLEAIHVDRWRNSCAFTAQDETWTIWTKATLVWQQGGLWFRLDVKASKVLQTCFVAPWERQSIYHDKCPVAVLNFILLFNWYMSHVAIAARNKLFVVVSVRCKC